MTVRKSLATHPSTPASVRTCCQTNSSADSWLGNKVTTVPSSNHSSCSPLVLGDPRNHTPTPLLTVAVVGAVVAVGAAVACGVGDEIGPVGVGSTIGPVVGAGSVAISGCINPGSVVGTVGVSSGLGLPRETNGITAKIPRKINATRRNKPARTQ